MEHRKICSSDITLPVITFGAWAIGGLFWGGSDDQDAVRAIHASIDEGINAIDTTPIVLFKPGTRFSYSNPGIIFLGRVIELLSGDDYEV